MDLGLGEYMESNYTVVIHTSSSEINVFNSVSNPSDKETPFLDLNVKVVGDDVHTNFYVQSYDFGL